MKPVYVWITRFVLVGIISFGPACSEAAWVPTNISMFPVQVEIGGSLGSGFFLQTSNRLFLVTAKHVLFEVAATNRPLLLKGTNLVFSHWETTNRHVAAYNIKHYYSKNEVRYSTDRDVAVVHVCDLVGTNRTLGYDLRYVNVLTPHWVPLSYGGDTFAKASEVQIAHDAFTFGYPVSVGSQITGIQIDSTRPLARKGIIADVDLRRMTLIVDMPVYFGNSGGPVLIADQPNALSHRVRIAGVVSQFIPFEDVWVSQRYKLPNVSWANSGYAVAEPIDFVLELLW